MCRLPLLWILGLDNNFQHIADIITNAREQALRKVNEELVLMYWNIGQFLSAQSKLTSYGGK